MPTKETREELEKHKLYLSQHIRALETRSKELRQKQYFAEKLAEKLREQELRLTQKINGLIKMEFPYLQMVNLEVKPGDEKDIALYLN